MALLYCSGLKIACSMHALVDNDICKLYAGEYMPTINVCTH